jgi:hypothetical protein
MEMIDQLLARAEADLEVATRRREIAQTIAPDWAWWGPLFNSAVVPQDEREAVAGPPPLGGARRARPGRHRVPAMRRPDTASEERWWRSAAGLLLAEVWPCVAREAHYAAQAGSGQGSARNDRAAARPTTGYQTGGAADAEWGIRG